MVRVGIVGYGYWGPNLARVFQDTPGAMVSAICETSPARRDAAQKRFPGAVVFGEVADMHGRRDVDLVVVATPPETHFRLAMAALDSGKHVLVEKPMTRSSVEAERLVELADRKSLVLAVDHTFVYTAAVEKAKALLDSGELGPIRFLDSVRINLGRIQEEVNVIWDLAPHDLSILDYLIGRSPIRVIAVGACHMIPGQVDVAYINLDYGQGLIANLHVNWLSPVKVRRMMIGGGRRALMYDDLSSNEKIRVYDSGATIGDEVATDVGARRRIDYRIGDILTPHLPPSEALANMAFDVIEAIEHKTPVRASGLSGLRTIRVLEACQSSLEDDGRRVLMGQFSTVAHAEDPVHMLARSVVRTLPSFTDSYGLVHGAGDSLSIPQNGNDAERSTKGSRRNGPGSPRGR